jgi:AhpD family alkylhydroperoxidase
MTLDSGARNIWRYTMMLEWSEYRQQISSAVGEIARLSPDTVRAHIPLGGAGARTGKLDAKIRELIALAVAVTRQCDGCINAHTDAAVKLGATREEIVEALGVAVAVNAGAALVFSARTLDAYAALTAATPVDTTDTRTS